ncbi:DMT family transporter [Nocardioides sp. AX2bis]|uniref:DMT family transporter n=1 Tax=Nocardioides sp. AX2bis TaxID=2653157 RepID=UPI0012F2815C|nr:SMR family transporter [Nocardioides sp. AX2bis]VXB88285.1 Small multidrug resistance pump [Nocardioides sp. AX2bis]
MTAALLVLAAVAEVSGTLSLRQSRGLRRPGWVAATAGAYLLAFGLLALVLQRGMPVGVAYGVWAALGIVITAVAGRLLFRDPLNAPMVAGMVVVLAGVALVELG